VAGGRHESYIYDSSHMTDSHSMTHDDKFRGQQGTNGGPCRVPARYSSAVRYRHTHGHRLSVSQRRSSFGQLPWRVCSEVTPDHPVANQMWHSTFSTAVMEMRAHSRACMSACTLSGQICFMPVRRCCPALAPRQLQQHESLLARVIILFIVALTPSSRLTRTRSFRFQSVFAQHSFSARLLLPKRS
jgi:hypothetical protein